jgi:lipoate-protein ligase A
MGPPWRVEEQEGKVDRLHAGSYALLDPGGHSGVSRSARVLRSSNLALVLGSAQPDDHVDRRAAEARGVEVVRRRSGGGAVLVGPDLVVWVDVVVPAGDSLWQADVGRAGWWLGEAWAGALADVGLPGAEVWRQGMIRSPWSDRVCFAGLGPGEVALDGRKMVGISQRRTRSGALFQCAVPVTWDPSLLLEVLHWPPGGSPQATSELRSAAAGVGLARAGPLVDAFVDRLP